MNPASDHFPMKDRLVCVVTTIQEPTSSLRKLHHMLKQERGVLVVVGDQKGPKSCDLEDVLFLTLEGQLDMDLCLAQMLPVGHYAGKNMGYLCAIIEGAG